MIEVVERQRTDDAQHDHTQALFEAAVMPAGRRAAVNYVKIQRL